MREFCKGLTRVGLWLVCVFLALAPHASFADALTQMEAYFTAPESVSGWVDTARGGMRYYAQNDELWAPLIYENSKAESIRNFGDAGCAPTAVAMAVRALVPAEELSKISAYAKREYTLCSCSLSKSNCHHRHVRYALTSDRDYERFLPLIFGDFAAGNNTMGLLSRSAGIGTGTGFIKGIAEIYGLSYNITTDYQQALDTVRTGGIAVALAARGGVFTNTGHYVTLIAADEESLYVLDPLCRETYKTNYAGKLHIHQPGYVSLLLEDVKYARLSSFMLFEKQ